MIKSIFLLLLVIGITQISCEMNDDTNNESSYEFEAKVVHAGIDCGDTHIIELRNISGDSAIVDNTYYADNLSEELKIVGLKIKLNCRFLEEDEMYPCTTLGIPYPHVFVIKADKDE